jgi:hypothetical protein
VSRDARIRDALARNASDVRPIPTGDVNPSGKPLEPVEVLTVIAQVLQRAGGATSAIGGSLGFRVHGIGGGDWIVNLGVAGGEWSQPESPEMLERCDTTLYAEREAFVHLLTAPELIEIDVKSGQLAVEGDRSKWIRVGRVLSAGGNSLHQRAAQSRRDTREAKNHRRARK